MAALYNLEPQPTAKVLLTTSSGDLLLELFAKQTPLASRSFLQHCLDGYYNDTIFHRLVPGFILQGGDPSGTGEGGESIYEGGIFEDEFHTRLKWSRRGLLGMANDGLKNTNGSQFFFSLGDCKELEGRNTMFGRVVGDTIFNMLKMADVELGEGEKPLYPTKITGAEILVNPFEDMVKRKVLRDVQRAEVPKEERNASKKAKKKGGKILLSFGGDEGEEEEVVVAKKDRLNPMLADANGGAETRQPNSNAQKPAAKSAGTNGPSGTTEKKPAKATRRRSSPSLSPPLPKRPAAGAQLPLLNGEVPSRSISSSPEPVQNMTSLLEKTNTQIADIKASMKRTMQAAPAKESKSKSALEMMIPANAIRGKKRKNGVKDTLDILSAFKSKLEEAPAEPNRPASPMEGINENVSNINENHSQTGNDNNDEEAALCDLHFIANCQSCRSWGGEGDVGDDDDKGWMSHVLSFEKDRLGKDLNFRKKKEDELVVIDPREKAKDIKGEQRAKKMARTGGSTAWAKDRDRGKEPVRRAGEKT